MKKVYSLRSVIAVSVIILIGFVGASERIVGGELTTIDQVPYQLSLEMDGVHVCGAAIVSDLWAITTANCGARAENNTDLFSLRSGSSFYQRDGNIHSVLLIVLHPDYDAYNYYQDVALLKVVEPFVWGATVAAVALADLEPALDAVCVLSGWGRTHSEYPVIPEQLRTVELAIIDLDSCDLMYQFFDGVSNSSLCAGVSAGGHDACDGDYGGPLVSPDDLLVGLSSWGKGCGQRGYPAVFQSVAMVREWLRETAGV